MIRKDLCAWNSNSKYCLCSNPEQIENYEKAINDTTQVWVCHHRLETHNSDGERRLVDLTGDELNALDIYYNRPPEELIFLIKDAHANLHHKGNLYRKGKHHSEETKQKMSAVRKGKPSNRKGKHWKLVDGKRFWY